MDFGYLKCWPQAMSECVRWRADRVLASALEHTLSPRRRRVGRDSAARAHAEPAVPSISRARYCPSIPPAQLGPGWATVCRALASHASSSARWQALRASASRPRRTQRSARKIRLHFYRWSLCSPPCAAPAAWMDRRMDDGDGEFVQFAAALWTAEDSRPSCAD
eukprot:scaffold146025_cov38-Tisochrysis_lutea.AAC.2